jgi:hypothetical protein
VYKRFVVITVALCAGFLVSACGNTSTAPSSPSSGTTPPPSSGTTPFNLSQVVYVDPSFIPVSGHVAVGATYDFPVWIASLPSDVGVVADIAFIRDDGLDYINADFIGGHGSDDLTGTMNPTISPIWEKGHTITAVLVVGSALRGDSDFDTLSRPCILFLDGPNGSRRVNWAAVKYQKTIAVWTVQ